MFTLKKLVTALEPISWSNGFKNWLWLSLLPSSVKMVWYSGTTRGPPTRMLSQGHIYSSVVSILGSLRSADAGALSTSEPFPLLCFHYIEIWNPISYTASRCQTFSLRWKSRPVENMDSVYCRISSTFCLKKIMVVGTAWFPEHVSCKMHRLPSLMHGIWSCP